MNINKAADNILFFFIGISVTWSCVVLCKRLKRDTRRLTQLNLQVVPATIVVEGVPIYP